MDVGIVGGSGYGGAELLRLLAAHPTLKVRTVAAHASAGRDLAEVFPHLGMAGTLATAEPEALDGCDVVFLATPAEASRALAEPLLAHGAVVVDLSDAYRLGGPDGTVYGLPELFRDQIPGARLVANPGCYPTAALLALAPLAGLVDPASVVVSGLSGTSGAGKGLRDDLHVSHAAGNTSAYGAPTHRHTPEIAAAWAQLTGGEHPVTFVPHLLPMPRGLLCTVVADLTADADPDAVRDGYAQRYDDEPFVTVLPDGTWPQTTHVRAANTARVGVAVDAAAGRVIASCAIDNLVKGAGGQAIQNANLVLGLPETAGLPTAAVYP
jgi:N-acetyl-gamma-glutamyl-phosphate reductase